MSDDAADLDLIPPCPICGATVRILSDRIEGCEHRPFADWIKDSLALSALYDHAYQHGGMVVLDLVGDHGGPWNRVRLTGSDMDLQGTWEEVRERILTRGGQDDGG